MEKYARWYASLESFYRLMVLVAVGIGLSMVAMSILLDTLALFALGMLWILGAPLVVHVAVTLENR